MAGNVPASLADDYVQRVNADLAALQGEQERVRAEIARLQGELGGLEKSKAVLTQIREVLSGAPTASAVQANDRAAAAVPAARSTRDDSSGTSGTAGKAGRGGGGRRGGRGGRKAGADKRASVGGLTWAGRVSAYLEGQGEPKSAAEVAAALSQTLPDRAAPIPVAAALSQTLPDCAAPTPVVRNTLEQGVAQGRIAEREAASDLATLLTRIREMLLLEQRSTVENHFSGNGPNSPVLPSSSAPSSYRIFG